MGDRSDKIATPFTPRDRLVALVGALQTKTELSKSTIEELLDKGWSFHQELGKPDRWLKTY